MQRTPLRLVGRKWNNQARALCQMIYANSVQFSREPQCGKSRDHIPSLESLTGTTQDVLNFSTSDTWAQVIGDRSRVNVAGCMLIW